MINVSIIDLITRQPDISSALISVIIRNIRHHKNMGCLGYSPHYTSSASLFSHDFLTLAEEPQDYENMVVKK